MSTPPGHAPADKAQEDSHRPATAEQRNLLDYTYNDLRRLLKLLPAPVRYAMPKPIAMLVARLFYLRRILPTEMGFDVVVAFCRSVANIFFREIQVRGC